MAGPLEQFVIKPIIPLEIAGMNLSFTNSSLWMTIAIIVAVTFFSLAVKNKAMVPNRLQAASEIMYEFVADMIRTNTGPRGRQYFPFVFTLFIVVFLGNILGLFPYSFTFTSHIIVTGALALAVFFAVTIFGFINHGVHFLTLFSPPGVPFVLKFLIIPIEIISFTIRPFTLAIRLFANMMAGHMVLKIFAGFSVMAASAGTFGAVFGLLPVFANVAVLFLELLVGSLQAYIFAILSCVYLKDSLDLHH